MPKKRVEEILCYKNYLKHLNNLNLIEVLNLAQHDLIMPNLS